MAIQACIPYLSVREGTAALAFFTRVFDTEPTLCLKLPDGRIMHCEFRFGETRLFLSEELLEHGGTPSPSRLGGTTVAIHLYVDDCDGMVGRMVNAGAELLAAPEDMFWGDRFARVRDPFGHESGINQVVRVLTAEEIHAEANRLFGL